MFQFIKQSASITSLARVVTIVAISGALAHSTAQAQGLPTLAPIVQSVSPAVVNISVSGEVEADNPLGDNPLSDNPLFRDFFNRRPSPRQFQSAGSGVIVDAESGLILTNHHVIENADEITVTLFDNRAATATIIGSDAASDLAVLRIETANLAEIILGNSEGLRVGDYVVAIGNPFGFSHTVTSGIVSGLGRSGINPDRSAYEDFIQTDASINPGNSGGALVTLGGELVGINSAIISRTGGNIGIGFAIPINMARNVMEQIIEFGEVRRGLLGVSISRITPTLMEQYQFDDTAGAFVTDITPGSAAEAAGLQIQDVIISVDGRPVDGPDALRNMIGLRRPAETVLIGLIRDGRQEQVTARLGTLETSEVAAAAPEPIVLDGEPVFPGVELAVDEGAGGIIGLRVVAIEDNSAFAAAGLRTGDLIVRLNRQRVTTLAQALALVKNSPRDVVALVRRGNRESIVLLP